MKFSQENTLNIVRYTSLLPENEKKSTLQHIHCCLKISIKHNYKNFQNSDDVEVLEDNYYPIIIDMDKLKDNYTSIQMQAKTPKSLDIAFVTQGNELIFTEYKFNRLSFSDVLDTLVKKIEDSKGILHDLENKYNFYPEYYVLYKSEDIDTVKDICRRKRDESNEEIYRRCVPMSLDEWYTIFFKN